MEKCAQNGNRITSTSSVSFQDACCTTSEKMARCVQNEPGKALLYSVGAGLGLGVLIGACWSGSSRSASNWIDRQTAERLGRKIMSSVGDWLPDSISDRI